LCVSADGAPRAAFRHVEALIAQCGSLLDCHDGIGEPVSLFSRHFQDMEGDALSRFWANAGQAPKLVDQGS
jgi:hypothetical protein